MSFHGIEGIENVYIYPLPEKFRLLSAPEVRERMSAGESHYQLSLEKWTKIKHALKWVSGRMLPDKYMHNFKDKIGYTTCSLCLEAIEKHREAAGKVQYKRDKCKFCPLQEIDCCINEDSSYRQIERLIDLIEKDLVFDIKESMKQLLALVDTMNDNITKASRT